MLNARGNFSDSAGAGRIAMIAGCCPAGANRSTGAGFNDFTLVVASPCAAARRADHVKNNLRHHAVTTLARAV
jgi:hypothetical protein